VYWPLLVVGAWYVLAAPLACAVGALNGYIFNRRWTFAARDMTRARASSTSRSRRPVLSQRACSFCSSSVGSVPDACAYVAAIPADAAAPGIGGASTAPAACPKF
jgi:putative flippase GtrA